MFFNGTVNLTIFLYEVALLETEPQPEPAPSKCCGSTGSGSLRISTCSVRGIVIASVDKQFLSSAHSHL
jgi:hypothetical protein